MSNSLTEIISCSYSNIEQHMQIVRISKPGSTYLERTMMPGQAIYFDAPADALLEIHESSAIGTIHADNIPCLQLQVHSISSHLRMDTTSTARSLTKAA